MANPTTLWPRITPSTRVHEGVATYAPVCGFVAVAAAVASSGAPWVAMMAVAVVIYGSGKWLTWRAAAGTRPFRRRDAAYLLAWPGMDAGAFCDTTRTAARPRTAEWVVPSITMIGGAAIVWWVVPAVGPEHELIAGYAGFLGLLMLLYFGAFHLVSIGWRCCGVDAQPIMCAPLASRSLSQFWGRRWNTPFRDLTHRYVFCALSRRLDPTGGFVAAFAASGLIHELVISVPARAGFGLPTAYFLLQGGALLVERSTPGRRLGLRRGVAGWAFAMVCVIAPAGLLFHRPFMSRVIVPMLAAIGAG